MRDTKLTSQGMTGGGHVTRDTTFTPQEDLDDWDEQDEEERRFDRWFDEHFVERLMPSARGGFEDAEENSAEVLSVCKSCGALVLGGGWHRVEYLNLHRAWHDANDKGAG